MSDRRVPASNPGSVPSRTGKDYCQAAVYLYRSGVRGHLKRRGPKYKTLMCDLGGAEQVDRALIDSNHFVVVWQKRVSLVSFYYYYYSR